MGLGKWLIALVDVNLWGANEYSRSLGLMVLLKSTRQA
jgi:hypothetical protein